MANKATLAINIISDASGARRGFEDATSQVDRFRDGLDRASVAAGGVLAGIGAIATEAFQAASDLQQTTGSINAVFGDWALDIEQSAQDAATAVGLSTSQYEGLAAVIGSQLKNAGMDIGDVTTQTQQLIATGADMAAVFGGTAADAVGALSSALKGEMDPIESYGVSLSQAAIDAQRAADGTGQLEGAAGKAAQTTAILELIAAQTADTTGQWAAQAGTAAEQTQMAGAAASDAAAALGEALLPLVADLAGKLQSAAEWAARNRDVLVPLVGVVAGLAGAVLLINGALAAYRAIMVVATAAQWLFNFAVSANPLVGIIVIIGLLIAAVVLAYQKFEWFRDLVSAIGDFLSGAWDGLIAVIGWIGDRISDLGDVWAAVFDWIADVMSPVTDVLSWIADKIGWVLDAAGSVGDFFGGLFSAPAGPAPGPAGVQNRTAAALFGAPAGGLLTAGGGGTSPAAAPGLPATTVINLTVNGAVDPLSTGRQITDLLRSYARQTGAQVAVSL
jgi:hypothetical protein